MRRSSKLSLGSLALLFFFAANTALLAISIAMMPYWITGLLVIPVIVAAILVWPDSAEYKGSILFSLLCAYIVIFSVWPQFSAYKIPGLPAIEPQRLVYASLLLTWALALFTNQEARCLFKERLRFGLYPVICLTAVYFFHFLSAALCSDPLWSFFFAFRELISVAIIFFVALLAIRDAKDVRRVFIFITVGAGVVSILAIVESLLKHNLFTSWVPLSTNYAQWATADRVRDGEYRVQAVFDNPLLLVDFFLLVWPVSCYLATEKRSSLLKLIGIGVSVLIPIALLRTGSRAALLVMLVEIGIFSLLWIWKASKTKTHGALPYLLAGSLLLLTLFIPFVFDDFKSLTTGRSAEEAMSSSVRVAMVTRAVDDVSKGNVFGHGFGRSSSVIGIKTGPPGGWIYVLDNYFVTLALDSGLLALTCYCAFWFWILRKSLAASLRNFDESGRIVTVVFIATSGFVIVKAISSQTQIFPLFLILTAALIAVLQENSKRIPS